MGFFAVVLFVVVVLEVSAKRTLPFLVMFSCVFTPGFCVSDMCILTPCCTGIVFRLCLLVARVSHCIAVCFHADFNDVIYNSSVQNSDVDLSTVGNVCSSL